MRVRDALTGEEDRILPLYEWLFSEPGYSPPGWDRDRARLALTEAIAAPESTVLVVEDADALIGFCSAYVELNSVRFGQRCWVEDLAVDPQRRSEGVGGALLDAAAEWARSAGATHIELDTGLARTDAQRFYQRRKPDSVGYSYSWRL
jgi:GNAT superfamily N-acetyltransferase